MANAKVYTGKVGAQELYKRIKGLIPAVDESLNVNSHNPISNRAVTLALAEFGGFQKVPGDENNRPIVEHPSNKVIYLVEVSGSPEPDHCMEWIWSTASGTPEWVCIGSTSINVDTELDPESGNPLANSTVTSEVNRLDTRIDELGLLLTDTEGTVTGTTMTVFVDNSTYTRFAVPVSVETLFITLADRATTGNASRSMFEFTLPENTSLDTVRVLDSQENDCLTVSPMSWPGTVTYQGTVTNGIATILGYSPTKWNGQVLSTDDGKLLTTSTGKHIRYVLA